MAAGTREDPGQDYVTRRRPRELQVQRFWKEGSTEDTEKGQWEERGGGAQETLGLQGHGKSALPTYKVLRSTQTKELKDQ